MKLKDLPVGNAPDAIYFTHFPSKIQAVIWRNWGLIPAAKLAKILGASIQQITELAQDMGLKDKSEVDFQLWRERGYITIIRRNWHLLPYGQLLELLEWTPQELAFTLKEDDFLYNKLGKHKPQVEPVIYAPLNKQQKLKTEKLKQIVETHFNDIEEAEEKPFEFLNKYGAKNKSLNVNSDFGLKLTYSYSAVYGDPLLDSKSDPYPEKLLEEYAANGINAVWLQGTLYTLVPWLGNTEYSDNWELRLENLRKLVKRAAKYGINIYLYMNEPRNMPKDFFKLHPDWIGAQINGGEAFAICTSKEKVLDALRDGMARLFNEVPDLGGVFTITMSENVTHCRSKAGLSKCPYCEQRLIEELPAEVNHAIAQGVHSVSPQADVIAWTWAWEEEWDERVIELLPKDVKLMCVGETNLLTDAIGIKGAVLDYSMSKIGPGPTAERLWKKAADCGLQSVAKVQLNNTWECSAVPYIPVPDLVEEYLDNLKAVGITDLMLSWTLGGYPGGNIELLRKSKESLVKEKYGENTASLILKACHKFSEAFKEFPLHRTSQLYLAPQNYGPMNLLFEKTTNYNATMLGFPYDDLKNWCGNHYPEHVFEEQFKKLSEVWAVGIECLRDAKKQIKAEFKNNYDDLLNVSEATYCHFRSTYLQICFIRLRNAGRKLECLPVLDEEIEIAKRLLAVVYRDSRIGFEASNHYYYTANDLKEKVLNCEYLKSQ